MSLRFKRAFQTVGPVAIVCTAFLQGFGQGESEATRRENDREIEQRAFNLGLLRAGRSTAKHSESKVVLAQVQEDFNRLQVVDNDLAEALSRSAALDLEFVVKSVKEIELLAKRLMNNLTQTKPRTTKPGPSDERPDQGTTINREQLKQWLVEMDKLIIEFAHNPVFKEESPDDAKLAAKALRDLDGIVKLSGQARKGTENLIKRVPR